MKFLWFSSSGDGLPIAYRMQEQGADIDVYVHNRDFRPCYEGMIKNRVSETGDLRPWLKDHDPATTTVIFDMVRPSEGTDEDKLLHRVRGVDPNKVKGRGLFGPFSDFLRDKGFRVIGMSKLSEKLEFDRYAGKEVARGLGLETLEYHEFSDTRGDSAIAKAVGFLRQPQASKIRWVLKPCDNQHLDNTFIESCPGVLVEKLQGAWAERLEEGSKFILEKYEPGITLDEEVWWDGSQFRLLNSTLEHKRFLTGDLGAHVGSMMNFVWTKARPLVPWDGVRQALATSGYIGPINATLQIGQFGKYFLEWTPRFGYDALFGLLRMFRASLAEFFGESAFSVYPQFRCAMSTRVSIPPYPYEDKKLLSQIARGVPVWMDDHDRGWMLDVREGVRGMECSGADGILGVVVGRGDTPADAKEDLRTNLGCIMAGADLQYRRDFDVILDEWKRLP